MKLFCESFNQKILPALRSLIAFELTNTHKLTQRATGEKLGLTQAAISQYLRNIRGSKVKLLKKDEVIYKRIQNFANGLASNISQKEAVNEFCKICMLIKKRKLVKDGIYPNKSCFD